VHSENLFSAETFHAMRVEKFHNKNCFHGNAAGGSGHPDESAYGLALTFTMHVAHRRAQGMPGLRCCWSPYYFKLPPGFSRR
jgi:hypothetical protein